LAAQGTFSDGRPHLFAVRVENDGSHRGVLSVDGRASTDITDDDARGYSDLPLRLGMRSDGQYGLSGEIAEVLIYGQPLTSSDRQNIEDYLAGKYNVTLQ
jgi:hypothetical protein